MTLERYLMTIARTRDQVVAEIKARSTAQPDGCLIYTGKRDRNGYGCIRFDGRFRTTHRLMYEAHRGPVPDGLVIDHLCHSQSSTCSGGRSCIHRACANPAHMEPVTVAENNRRGVRIRKTECVNGHEYTPENTGRQPTGRYCRTCSRERSLARYHARKAVAA